MVLAETLKSLPLMVDSIESIKSAWATLEFHSTSTTVALQRDLHHQQKRQQHSTIRVTAQEETHMFLKIMEVLEWSITLELRVIEFSKTLYAVMGRAICIQAHEILKLIFTPTKTGIVFLAEKSIQSMLKFRRSYLRD